MTHDGEWCSRRNSLGVAMFGIVSLLSACGGPVDDSTETARAPLTEAVSSGAAKGQPTKIMRKRSRGTIESPVTDLPKGPLVYHNGVLLGGAKIVPVFWGPNVNSTVRSSISGFYKALEVTPALDWLNDAYAVGFDQSIRFDTSLTIPTFTITPTQITGTSIFDFIPSIADELAGQIKAGNLPQPDDNTLYMVHFPPGIVISIFGTGPNGIDTSCQQFCAYHKFQNENVGTGTPTNIYYGVVPDFGAGGGCDMGCGDGTMFQNVTMASSHEVVEAMTDPQVFTPPAWGWTTTDSMGEGTEIGDICNQIPATIRGTGGASYTMQKEYSNATQDCQARRDMDWAFVRTTQTTGTFFPDAAHSRSSALGLNVGESAQSTVTQNGTGQYTVSFPSIGEVVGGNFQVAAFGTGSQYCNIASWSSNGWTLNANVNCFTAAGNPTNTLFAIDYVRYSELPVIKTGQISAYLRTDTGTSSHTPAAAYQWNITGATNTIVRNSTGNYTATLPGVWQIGDNVMVSAYGNGTARCKISGWSPSAPFNINVGVRCFATNGNPADSRFTLRYGATRTIEFYSSAYAWADQASPTGTYTPSLLTQKIFLSSGGGAGGNISAGKNGTGNYFLNIPTISPDDGRAIVSAFGTTSTYCKPSNWRAGNGFTGTEIDVRCFNNAGGAADSQFVVSFANMH